MLVVNKNERACCTCNHWMGMRVVEEKGYVYSLENLEGTCKSMHHLDTQITIEHPVTLPNASCTAWEIWPESAA
ncbi:MAG: hypothetical protein KGZ83_11645 [Sulfuricella sp.]|nr:hypothetical protein [Sulfuricella sp.]